MSGSRDFGKIVNERRLALGYSLGQLANRMGTTATKVRAWERGDALPDDEMLDQLADELNMSVGVLRATLPEPELDLDELTGEQTAAIAGAVFSDAADTAAAEVDELDAEAPFSGPGDETEAPMSGPGDEAEAASEDEPSPEEEQAEVPEPTAVVAAVAAEDDADSPDATAEPVVEDTGPEAESEAAGDEEPDADSRLADLPTEAVPILPPVPVVEPGGGLVAAPAMVATAPAPARIDPNDLGLPESSGFFAPVERFMSVVFDPERSYLFWIRVVLILIVFFVLLRILAWAVPEFFDALKDILDTIESSPTEADPGTSFIDG